MGCWKRPGLSRRIKGEPPDSGAAIPTPKFHPKIPARGFIHRSFKLIPFSCFSRCPPGKRRLGLEFSFPSFCSPCGAGNSSRGNNPVKPKSGGRDPSPHSKVWKLGFGKGAAGTAPSCPGSKRGNGDEFLYPGLALRDIGNVFPWNLAGNRRGVNDQGDPGEKSGNKRPEPRVWGSSGQATFPTFPMAALDLPSIPASRSRPGNPGSRP